MLKITVLQKKFNIYLVIIVIMGILAGMGCASQSKNIPVEPIMLPSPSPTEIPYEPLPQASGDYYWWNKTVFYEIFVRSFFDSNADGIGDLQGLMSKLDYLNDGDPATQTDLGINGIWLMPIFASSSYHGYDVTDYYSVNPDYGTLEDFKLLIEEAHKRGIRIIIDFVINHTSSKHPWFVSARADVNSPYRDWYIWSETKPDYSGPWGQKVWHFNYDNQYYYGVFSAEMPDLNFKNAEVTQEIYKIADFWTKEMGVDGFRVDGARHLVEDGKIQANSAGTYSWFESFQVHLKERNNQLMTVGEVWDSNFAAVKYVKDAAFDLVFDFELSESLLEGLNRNDAAKIRNALEFNTKLYPPMQKANFLTNHDMNRVMNSLLNDPGRAKMAAVLLMSAPGVPFIYYGEEIGMIGSKPDENIRKPMQWNSSEHAGFSVTYPWRDPNSDFLTLNVDMQNDDSESLLNFYRKLIHIRNQNIALQVGSSIPLRSSESGLVTFLREYEDNFVFVILNAGKSRADFSFEFPAGILPVGTFKLTSLLDGETFLPLVIEDSTVATRYQSGIQLQSQDFLLITLQKD